MQHPPKPTPAIPRRDFLARTSVATLGAMGLAGQQAQASTCLASMSPTDFNDAIGSDFAIPECDASLVLTEVRQHRRDPGRPRKLERRIGFSLMFERRAGNVACGTYQLQHPRQGKLTILLSQVGKDQFEAVFN